MKTKIYGASDDLIEIEGAISEEIDCYDTRIKLSFSDGTVIKSKYNDDGNWEFEVIEKGDKFIKYIEAVGEEQVHSEDDSEEVPNYSGFVVLSDGIEWMKIGNRKFKAAGV